MTRWFVKILLAVAIYGCVISFCSLSFAAPPADSNAKKPAAQESAVLHESLDSDYWDWVYSVGCVNDYGDWYIQGTARPGTVVSLHERGNNSRSLSSKHSEIADKDGYFYLPLENLPLGPHTIDVAALDPITKKSKTTKLSMFVNNITIGTEEQRVDKGSPFKLKESFDPSTGGSLHIPINSAIDNDVFSAEVLDPFFRESGTPFDDSEKNNERPWGRLVKKLWVRKTLKSGKSILTWDATDNKGAAVPAGPYLMRIRQASNTPENNVFFDVLTIVQRNRKKSGTQLPIISDIKTSVKGTAVTISWKTNTITTGYLLYIQRWICFRDALKSNPSRYHSIRIPNNEDWEPYNFWIVVKDSNGNTCSSEEHYVMSDVGEHFGSPRGKMNRQNNTGIKKQRK